jgi:tRNA threonylcarbamoyladenosine biosynthesis protein TsaE
LSAEIRKFTTRSAGETRELGRSLSSCLQPGQVVCLRGELGSGKTCLAQGICLGWGVSEPVVSPSFTLVNEYQGRSPVYHFDLYRLKSPGELENIGYLEYLEGGGLVLIEWPENAGKELPQDRLDIAIGSGKGDERSFTAEPRGGFLWKGEPRC